MKSFIRAFAFTGLMSLCLVSVASPPVDGPPAGIPDADPSAGFSRTVRINQILRELAPGDGVDPRALSGVRKIPVICVAPRNRPPAFPSSEFQHLLFAEAAPGQPAPLSMTQFYSDMSRGIFKLTGQVFGWYELPNDDAYYENACNGCGPEFGELLTFALRKADSETDFGQFDNDGPDGVPNSGDDDGKVDVVFFVHSESGGECGGSTNIWSHSGKYGSANIGTGKPFETSAFSLGSDGKPRLNPDGTQKRVLVTDYTIQPGLSCSKPGEPAKMASVGVFCHELGHALGLPDLYDRTPRNRADSSGIGVYCCMSSGSYGGDGKTKAHRPISLSAWCRAYLGWARVIPLDKEGILPIEPACQSGMVYRLESPHRDPKEYLLLEFRCNQAPNLPPNMVNWDRDLPASGLAVWHIDEHVGELSPRWPFSLEDSGQNDTPTRSGAGNHALITLLQADGRNDLEGRTNLGDADDLWNGTKSFDGGVQQRSFQGTPWGIVVKDFDPARGMFVQRLTNSSTSATLASSGPESAPSIAGAEPEGLTAAPPVSDATETFRDSAPPPAPSTAPDQTKPASPPGEKPSETATDEKPVSAIPPSSASSSPPSVASTKTRNSPVPAMKSARLEKAKDEIELKGTKELSRASTEELKKARPQEIQEAFPNAADRLSVQAAASQLRTQTITPQWAPKSPIETELVHLTAQSLPGYQKTTVQLDASENRVERLEGVKIPLAAIPESPEKLRDFLRPLIGSNATLRQSKTETENGATQITFEQTVLADDIELPLFGGEVRVFIDKEQNISALQSTIIPPNELKIARSPMWAPSAEDARQLIIDALGLPKESEAQVSEIRKGVYLQNKDPSKARVGYEVQLKMGGDRDIKLYLDCASLRPVAAK